MLRVLVKKLLDEPKERKRLLALLAAGEHKAVLTKLERTALELARGKDLRKAPEASPRTLLRFPPS